ncbi:MAG: hypothetical protein V2J24_23630 [Pseudomonadales bacterium]|jgi:hypothetical protein|nr:hypothetical protein [Pseudomonadales bacterium]
MAEAARDGSVEEAAARIEAAMDEQEQHEAEALDDDAPADEEQEELAAEEGDEETTADDEGTEDDPDEESEEADDEGEEEAEEETEPSNEEPIESFAELAAALESDPEDLMTQLKVSVKVAGEEQEVTLKEALSGYQREADYVRKTQAVSEQKRAYEERASNVARAMQVAQQISKAVHEQTMKTLAGELNSDEMQALMKSNPAQYVIRRDAIRERAANLQRVQQAAVQHYEQTEKQQQAQFQEDFEAYRNEELALLQETVPDWGEASKSSVREILREVGFGDDEIGSVVDHRWVRLALMAAKSSKATEESAPPKGVKAPKAKPPKALKPGKEGQARRPSRRQKQLQAARKRLKASGSVSDLAAVIEQSL